MRYVLARPCLECEEETDNHDKHELSYLMEGTEDAGVRRGKTKVFQSRSEAKDWLQHNLPVEHIDKVMVIPLPEVSGWNKGMEDTDTINSN